MATHGQRRLLTNLGWSIVIVLLLILVLHPYNANSKKPTSTIVRRPQQLKGKQQQQRDQGNKKKTPRRGSEKTWNDHNVLPGQEEGAREDEGHEPSESPKVVDPHAHMLKTADPNDAPTDAPEIETAEPTPVPETEDPGKPGIDNHPDTRLVQQFLAQTTYWRERHRPKRMSACFVSLVRHSQEGISRLSRLLKNVEDRWPYMAHRYPFVAFLEEQASKDDIETKLEQMGGKKRIKLGGRLPLRHIFPGGLLLEHLSDGDFGKVPDFVQPESHRHWSYPSSAYWGIPYRHMCRFFGVRIMFQSALDRFDYYIRLDTDSYILSPSLTTVPLPARVFSWETGQEGSKWQPLLQEVRGHHSHDFNKAAGPGAQLTGADEEELFEESVDGRTKGRHIASPKKKHNASEEEDPLAHIPKADPHTLLGQLGYVEREAQVDLFHEMAVRQARYGFNMLHPQTMPQFLRGLWEAYDEFVKKETGNGGAGSMLLPEDHDGQGNVHHGRSGSGGPDPFGAPRGVGLHYWDNFEVVDLRVFRPFKKLMKRLRTQDAFEEHLSESDRNAASATHDDRMMQMVRFLDFMDRKGGFYYHRWGDAEMRTLLVTLFFTPQETAYVNNMGYQHYHNYHCLTPISNVDRGDLKLSKADLEVEAHQAVEGDADEKGLLHSEMSRVAKAAKLIRAAGISKPGHIRNTPQILAKVSRVMDDVLRVLSGLRDKADKDAASECHNEARHDHGHGKKGRGGADMHPAERPHDLTMFWDNVRKTSAKGGWPVI